MVAGIELSQGMLSALRKRFSDKDISLIVGSYFDVPFGEALLEAGFWRWTVRQTVARFV